MQFTVFGYNFTIKKVHKNLEFSFIVPGTNEKYLIPNEKQAKRIISKIKTSTNNSRGKIPVIREFRDISEKIYGYPSSLKASKYWVEKIMYGFTYMEGPK